MTAFENFVLPATDHKMILQDIKKSWVIHMSKSHQSLDQSTPS